MKIPRSILERRRSIRIAEALPFTIDHRGYELEARTVNISETGAWCVIDREIPVMTKLNVCLSLPGASGRSKKIRLKGTIVRREKEEQGRIYIAVYFSEIKPADAETLRAFIDRRLKK